LGGGVVELDCGQVAHDVLRRVAAPDDSDPSPGEACALDADDVGDPAADPVPVCVLAERRLSRSSERVRGPPRTGGVDDGPRTEPFDAVGRLDREDERPAGAAFRAELVDPVPGDADDASFGPDGAGDRSHAREGLQVPGHELAAGGERRTRRLGPARRLEQATCRGGHVERPRREQLDVRPLPHRRADRRAGLEDDERQPTLDEPGGGGQPDWAGADHGDRQVVQGTLVGPPHRLDGQRRRRRHRVDDRTELVQRSPARRSPHRLAVREQHEGRQAPDVVGVTDLGEPIDVDLGDRDLVGPLVGQGDQRLFHLAADGAPRGAEHDQQRLVRCEGGVEGLGVDVGQLHGSASSSGMLVPTEERSEGRRTSKDCVHRAQVTSARVPCGPGDGHG
jgi:hypothetical protein